MRTWIYYIVIWAFIILYGYTALDKLAGIEVFIRAIRAQVFPDILVIPLAWGIPLLEALIFILLLIPRTEWLGLRLATGLMLLFTGYTGLGAVDGFADSPCGCAGIFRSFSWAEHFWFNLCFLLGGLAAIVSQGWKPTLRIAVPVIIIFSLGYGCSQKAQQHSKQTNFYRIQGEFYQRIDSSAMDRYMAADSGCVYAIASEAVSIPLADRPKKQVVLFLSRPGESPNGVELTENIETKKGPPEGGSNKDFRAETRSSPTLAKQ